MSTWNEIVQRVRAKLEKELGSETRKASDIQPLFEAALDEEAIILSRQERQRVFEMVVAQPPPEPWEILLADDTTREFVVLGPNQVFVRHSDSASLEKITSIQFRDEAHVVWVINRVLRLVNQHLNHETPSVQVLMPDGSHVWALLDTFGTGHSLLMIQKPL